MPSGDQRVRRGEEDTQSFIACFYVFGKCPIYFIVLVCEEKLARKINHDLQGNGWWGNKTRLLSRVKGLYLEFPPLPPNYRHVLIGKKHTQLPSRDTQYGIQESSRDQSSLKWTTATQTILNQHSTASFRPMYISLVIPGGILVAPPSSKQGSAASPSLPQESDFCLCE